MPVRVDVTSELSMDKQKMLWACRQLNKAAVLQIDGVVAEEAKKLVPVRSGLLRETIRGKARKARGEDAMIATISTNTKGKWKEVTKKNGEPVKAKDGRTLRRQVKYGYGRDVETGRPSGGYKSTPYLKPAVIGSLPEIERIYKAEAVKAALKTRAK